MANIEKLLELLKKLIHSTIPNIVKISKTTLADIQICLKDAHEKIEFLQLESQFQRNELKQESCHSELVFVQIDSHQQQVDSDLVPNEVAELHAKSKNSACTSQANHQTLGRACPQQAQNSSWI